MPPTTTEQDKIAEVLTATQREIDLLAAQREQVEHLRRALLSKLLSGSLSVPV
jgi:restriction endonuclease S subunit